MFRFTSSFHYCCPILTSSGMWRQILAKFSNTNFLWVSHSMMLSASGLYIMLMMGWLLNMEQLVKWKFVGQTKILSKPAPVLPCPPHIPHDLSWDWTWASAVRSWWLTTSVTVWPSPTPNFMKTCHAVHELFVTSELTAIAKLLLGVFYCKHAKRHTEKNS